MLSLQEEPRDLSPGSASKTSLLLLCLQRAPKQETAPNQIPPLLPFLPVRPFHEGCAVSTLAVVFCCVFSP